MTAPTDSALLLAGGRGTRMQRPDPGAPLDAEQERLAALGVKSMVPDARGRPLLDHILTSLADAGIRRVGIVVPPGRDAIASHLSRRPPRRVAITTILQQEPTGTAHAVLTAIEWAGNGPFLVLNADNLYDITLLAELARVEGPACAAFDADVLVERSNFPADRVRAFARLVTDSSGLLLDVVEKPTDAMLAVLPSGAPVSMNLWRFDSRIFPACRDVGISERGEHELPGAVSLAVTRGMPCHLVRTATGVLDLSARGDIAAVAMQLAQMRVDP
ncbi:MAG: nucleotidyltransferase family protein [Gemmatimonadales bacterium]|nr:nucleotidyltransferase family protein [Gemmatimonadales bacterium]